MDIDYYLGGIVLFPYNFAPTGWLLCDGRDLTINQYQALYALIAQRFGSSSPTTFKIPNLVGAEPIPGMAYYIATTGIFPSRP